MANPEHLEILRQGVEVWNQWREEHPTIQPNLREIDLDSAHLGGIHLQEADLNGMITNDKFCCTRWCQLRLSWWRRPLRLREESSHDTLEKF